MIVRRRDVGLIDPDFGEGPGAALVSGKCASEAVASFLSGKRSRSGHMTAVT